MYRAALRQLAFKKCKGRYHKFGGLQKGITGKNLLEAVDWWSIQPRQGQVWGIFLFFARDTNFCKFLFNGLAQNGELVGRLYSGPKNARGAAWWKDADTAQPQGNFR